MSRGMNAYHNHHWRTTNILLICPNLNAVLNWFVRNKFQPISTFHGARALQELSKKKAYATIRYERGEREKNHTKA